MLIWQRGGEVSDLTLSPNAGLVPALILLDMGLLPQGSHPLVEEACALFRSIESDIQAWTEGDSLQAQIQVKFDRLTQIGVPASESNRKRLHLMKDMYERQDHMAD